MALSNDRTRVLRYRVLLLGVVVSLVAGCKIKVEEDAVGVYLDDQGNISKYEIPSNTNVDIGLSKPGVANYLITPIRVQVKLRAGQQTAVYVPEGTISIEYRIDPNLAADFRLEHGAWASRRVLGRGETYASGQRYVEEIAQRVLDSEYNVTLARKLEGENEEDVRAAMQEYVARVGKAANRSVQYFEFGWSELNVKGWGKFHAESPGLWVVPTELKAESALDLAKQENRGQARASDVVVVDTPFKFIDIGLILNLGFAVIAGIFLLRMLSAFSRRDGNSSSTTKEATTSDPGHHENPMKPDRGVIDYTKRLS